MFTRHVFDRLAAYAERQLDAADAAAVERHLRDCAQCRGALEEIRRGIALASELEPMPMPAHVAARIRREILHGRPGGRAVPAWLRVAAAALALLTGVAVYWQVNRPWADLRAAESSATAFEREGRAVHDRVAGGNLRLAFATSDEHEVWRWLASQRAPVTSLRPNRSPADRRRFVPVGAVVETLAGARTSVISYRIDGAPVTLMLAHENEVPDAPPPGWWSKRVAHRRDGNGVNTLTWTVGGGTYVLVSELEGYGQRACFICHTDERFQRPISAMSLR